VLAVAKDRRCVRDDLDAEWLHPNGLPALAGD
jgi:hypothetical protein